MSKDRQLYTLILSILSVLVAGMISLQLLSSWTQPQAQSQLNLYESDLLLQASAWQETNPQPGSSPLIEGLWGDSDPVEQALKNYRKIRESSTAQSVSKTSGGVGAFIDELDLRLGLLYAKHDQVDDAIATWTHLINESKSTQSDQRVKTATVLRELWRESPQMLPQAEEQIQSQLKGWFRYQGLAQLKQLQQRPDDLTALRLQEHTEAETALTRLIAVQVLPAFGGILGLGILVFWLVQAVIKKRQGLGNGSSSLEGAAPPANDGDMAEDTANPSDGLAASVSWPITTIWQVMVVWFTAFFCVSFILPVVLYIIGAKPETFGARGQAYLALAQYSLLMAVGFSILYLSLKPFLTKPIEWLPLRLQGPWLRWGLSGYLAALPLVVVISLLNQKLLQNQGGGNPLLEIILNSHDSFSMGLLLFMVAVLAPLFEEILFRGFFLTSLTRYLPTWGAIGLSGLVFAIAHLNLSDILPLTVLGCMLGFVYTRSRNLLASMLLHGLWNSGSFLGLILLGSSVG
ncbi:MAG: lysostaphin resistance A-like protein [Thermosynechococcaceae cyanobacterium]